MSRALFMALRERKCHNCDFEEKEERKKREGRARATARGKLEESRGGLEISPIQVGNKLILGLEHQKLGFWVDVR
ncbi:unnamed protein product [Trifolium pratense]|uniref:Uncharacterized protein n=1 Tax=Trifolium pratense TaxID=57577 RepID=A0ACB0LUI2_TRIPR|nr:unnamed protein product [Trifolium pratense]